MIMGDNCPIFNVFLYLRTIKSGEFMLKYLLLWSLLLSCAPSSQEKIDSAVREARFYLSSSKCSKAKEVLDDVGFQDDDADYVMAYASVYGCLAGYSELDDVFSNLDKIDPNEFVKSVASFTTSIETAPDSTNYSYLMQAINTILNTGGGSQPSTAARNSEFGGRKSGDMSMQVLYLLLVQMGKYFALYGNADNAGDKGLGADGNTCIYSYTTQDAVDWITNVANPGGTCAAATGSEGSDHLEAPETAADIKRRLCEGIFLYNNFVDVLGNLTLPNNDSLGDLGDVEAALALLLDAAEAAEETGGGGVFNDGPAASRNAIENLRVIRSQSACETEDLGRLEKWHAIFFETIWQ